MVKRPAPILLPILRRDIRNILHWSEAEFGEAAAARYATLLRQALRDIQQNPRRPGAKPRPDLAPNAYTYHLRCSRDHVTGKNVKAPRHFVLYRFTGSVVEFARILHDSRDLSQYGGELEL